MPSDSTSVKSRPAIERPMIAVPPRSSDALAPYQLIELHPILHQQWPDWQDIELAKVNQLCVTSRRQATNEIQ
jgi:hypothetical protein